MKEEELAKNNDVDESPLSELLVEERVIEAPEEFKRAAVVTDDQPYRRASADPEAYWADWAEQLDWYEPWEKVLEWNPPHAT